MKKILFSLLATSTLLFTACSEKFEVAAPYKDITVVYGFLDINDSAHYVRIQKAFLDENKSALTMAQVADSNFYADIRVTMERRRASGSNSGSLVDSILLNRVDLVQEGYNKENGVFFTAPNYAYKFTDLLEAQYIYRLKIRHLSTGAVDSVDAPALATNTTSFKVDIIDDAQTNLYGMNFFSVKPNRNFKIDGRYEPVANYNYKGEVTPANIAQAIIRFNWDDSDIIAKTRTSRYYDFDAGYASVNPKDNYFEFKMENRNLYRALAAGMGQAPSNVIRLISRCNISVYLSTSDYTKYRQAILIQGNGLTGSEISPVYTNVEGKNVLGLYTSRVMHSGLVTIDKLTVDSLIASPILTHTNLKGTAY